MIEGNKYKPVLYDKNLKNYKKFVPGTLEYAHFWKEQRKRILNGYKPTGGIWIPGNYYFYLNFSSCSKIDKSSSPPIPAILLPLSISLIIAFLSSLLDLAALPIST